MLYAIACFLLDVVSRELVVCIFSYFMPQTAYLQLQCIAYILNWPTSLPISVSIEYNNIGDTT